LKRYPTKKMTAKLAIILTALSFAVIIDVEILRSVVHRLRERAQGIGGPQDIAIRGIFLGLAFFIGAGTLFFDVEAL
jgi:hypothetical protein